MNGHGPFYRYVGEAVWRPTGHTQDTALLSVHDTEAQLNIWVGTVRRKNGHHPEFAVECFRETWIGTHRDKRESLRARGEPPAGIRTYENA